MADLVTALGAALRGRYRWLEPKTPVTNRQGLKARLNRIQKIYGGDRRAAAAAAGIPYSTWGHLMSGKRKASPRTLGRVESAYSRIIVAPSIAGQIAKKGYPRVWSITAVVVADPEGRRYINGHPSGMSKAYAAAITTPPGYRTFNADGLPNRAIVDAWIHHGDQAAAQKLLEEIERAYSGAFGFEGNRVEVTLIGRA